MCEKYAKKIKLFLKIKKIINDERNVCVIFLCSLNLKSISGKREKVEYKKIIGSFLRIDNIKREKV